MENFEEQLITGRQIVENIKMEIMPIIKELQNGNIYLKIIAISSSTMNNYSNIYKHLKETCENINIKYEKKDIDNLTENEVIKFLKEISKKDDPIGILIENPLPKQFDIYKLNNAITAKKNINFFKSKLYRLYNEKGLSNDNIYINQCVIEILNKLEISTKNKKITILNDSSNNNSREDKLFFCDLLHINSDLQICDRNTKDIQNILKNSDFIIIKKNINNLIIDKNYIKENSIIIDLTSEYDENGMFIKNINFADTLNLCKKIIQIPTCIDEIIPIMVVKNLINNIITGQ